MDDQDRNEIADKAPESETITDYDRTQLRLYARLLDAEADGAGLLEIADLLFDIDAESEPERARKVHDSHLARAHWLAAQGYRNLLVQA